MNQPLEFMNCPSCGKRVRTTAKQCHRCQSSLRGAPGRQGSQALSLPLADSHEDASTAHLAPSAGGYAEDQDDFDYHQFLADEGLETHDGPRTPRVKLWIWLTAWLLIIAMLLPFFIQFVH
jgi:hypothetical protein